MTKTKKILYWVSTGWLALGMISTGIGQLVKMENGQGALSAMDQLGYPSYLMTLLGIWKCLGVVAILIPRMPLLKEWAYAGFFFAMSGAVFSHVATGHVAAIFPALVSLVLTVLSWYLRPDDRKLISSQYHKESNYPRNS